MKKISYLLSFVLLISIGQLQAQEKYYTVSGLALSEIDQDLIAVSFLRATFGSRNISFYVEINHGQDCMNTTGIMGRHKFIKKCSGLVNEEGEPIIVNNYINGLNLLNEQGWELVTVAVDTNMEGASEPESHEYILRKKKPAKLDRNKASLP